VRQKGTACDIARAASGLHDRAEELLKFDAIVRTLDDFGHADVKFMSSDVIVDSTSKTLGEVRLNVVKSGESVTVLLRQKLCLIISVEMLLTCCWTLHKKELVRLHLLRIVWFYIMQQINVVSFVLCLNVVLSRLNRQNVALCV